jgi:acyl-CoA thioesterase-1
MKYSLPVFSFFFLFLIACGNPAAEKPQKTRPEAPVETGNSQKEATRKTIVFFGNSLTAAYKLDPAEGYVHLLQLRLDSLGLPYRTVNAGLSGETATAGNQRINWVLRQPVDIFVLELGGNDALRGIDPEVCFQSLDSILTKVKSKYPEAKLVVAGMEAPPNLGPDYIRQFHNIYPRLAEKHGAALIPFFLEGVGGVSELNLPDGIHPNAEGQKVVLENVWKVLYPLLEPAES